MLEKWGKINTFLENNKKIAWLIWLFYVIFLCFVSYYHEPWHDEGQAWLIARDDSIWRLLTVTTHLEGHPPLWHLLLMPFAKGGVPFEWGIKSVNIACCSLAMWLVILKSPMPWYLRFSIPFSYFFFYQYGVVNRVYSLLMLGTMLTAYYYGQRHTKPYHLVMSMVLMSGSQAYGMMLAFGVAVVWLAEILNQFFKEKESFIRFSKESKEIHALLLLFVVSLMFGLLIIPRNDTAFFSGGAKKDFWQNMFYSLFIVPGQILFSNDIKDGFSFRIADYFFTIMKNDLDMIPNFGIYGILLLLQHLVSYSYGIILHITFIYFSYKEHMLCLYLVPLLSYSVLASLVFWNLYHLGILAFLCVFMLWQLYADDSVIQKVKCDFFKNFTSKHELAFVKAGLCLCFVAVVGTNLYWSGSAAIHDIYEKADVSSEIANFIKKNKLTNATIWCGANETEIANTINITTGSLAVNCYFDKNVIQNLDGGYTGHAYHEYRLLKKEDYMNSVRKFGPPDFILLTLEGIDEIFGKSIEYLPIHKFSCYTIWKDGRVYGEAKLYIRADLLSKYSQFSVIEDDKK